MRQNEIRKSCHFLFIKLKKRSVFERKINSIFLNHKKLKKKEIKERGNMKKRLIDESIKRLREKGKMKN